MIEHKNKYQETCHISDILWDFNHPVVTFNNSFVAQTPCQKHLGLYLDEKLNVSHHIKEKISKACKSISVIRKLRYVLPGHSLLTIYVIYKAPSLLLQHHIRPANTIYNCRIDTFKHLFLRWIIVEWNKLDLQCCKSTYTVFKNHLLKSMPPVPNFIYNQWWMQPG